MPGCRFTWVDDLYFFYKRKEVEAGAAADTLRLEHIVAGLRARTSSAGDAAAGDAAATESAAAEAGDTGSADAPAETTATAAQGDRGAEGAEEAGGESEEPQELTAEQAAERVAERHAWMKGDVRRSLREARMLAKLTVRPPSLSGLFMHRLVGTWVRSVERLPASRVRTFHRRRQCASAMSGRGTPVRVSTWTCACTVSFRRKLVDALSCQMALPLGPHPCIFAAVPCIGRCG